MINDSLKKKIRQLPQGPGVYLMKDRLGSILYVGKAKHLRKRVSSYFQRSKQLQEHQPKIASMVRLVHDLDVVEVKNEAEALLLEGRLIKEWKPKYNTLFVDDKQFLLIRVDVHHPFPQFRLVRSRRDDRALYFGPFPHASHVRKTLKELRSKFGVLVGDSYPKELGPGHYQLYGDVRGEIYGHANEVTKEVYRQRADDACAFLKGEACQWLESLECDMARASEKKDFERAAKLRDILFAIRETTTPLRKFTHTKAPAASVEEGLVSLQEAIGLIGRPVHIECFDISHISGTFTVASMVHFSEGRPDKSQYRRYRIRSFSGNDDFRAMEEVVGRRYRRLHLEGKALPDLVVIDGGRGQVNAALKAFLVLDIPAPFLVGLAKREEAIVFADGREDLKLPHASSGLHLLQRIRDEAHRFANTYNADLRRRKMRESILDEVPGLGPSRRAALLAHFKTIEGIRAASISDLKRVEGVGLGLAARIYEGMQALRKRGEGESDPLMPSSES